MRIIGIDPGLNHTGWGVIEQVDNRLVFIACGRVSPKPSLPVEARLAALHEGLTQVFQEYRPAHVGIEETFMNNNASSAIRLGMARGAAFLVPGRLGLSVHEYAANQIKKAVTGAGHAGKGQIGAMVRMLLPLAEIESEDAADALAIAICHAHHIPMLEREASCSQG